jgi:hypothetical protein
MTMGEWDSEERDGGGLPVEGCTNCFAFFAFILSPGQTHLCVGSAGAMPCARTIGSVQKPWKHREAAKLRRKPQSASIEVSIAMPPMWQPPLVSDYSAFGPSLQVHSVHTQTALAADNLNTTQTLECTKEEYNAKIKVKGSLLRSHQQPT